MTAKLIAFRPTPAAKNPTAVRQIGTVDLEGGMIDVAIVNGKMSLTMQVGIAGVGSTISKTDALALMGVLTAALGALAHERGSK